MVYFSLGEGFGLLVLEVLVFGVVVLIMFCFVLFEVGGDVVVYLEFDVGFFK